jgi:uncharacterized membrane protein YhaH (DUF805 family)
MQALRFLFSPYGRLRPRPFLLAAIAVYAAGLMVNGLTEPRMLAYGLWPFAAAEALLIWMWFALHAKRLRDAGHGSGLAAGVSLLYALSVMLLLLIGAAFLSKMMAPSWGAAPTSTLGLINLILVNDLLFTYSMVCCSPHYDVTWIIVAGLTIMAFLPPAIAMALTVWAATRPSAPERKA